jgi:toxin ParE1/3/4
MPERKIKVKPRAEQDLSRIYKYSKDEFGSEKAEAYLRDLDSFVKKLSQNPEIGLLRQELGKKLYSFPIVSHIVFYRFTVNELIIVRVLHKSRDFISHL